MNCYLFSDLNSPLVASCFALWVRLACNEIKAGVQPPTTMKCYSCQQCMFRPPVRNSKQVRLWWSHSYQKLVFLLNVSLSLAWPPAVMQGLHPHSHGGVVLVYLWRHSTDRHWSQRSAVQQCRYMLLWLCSYFSLCVCVCSLVYHLYCLSMSEGN